LKRTELDVYRRIAGFAEPPLVVAIFNNIIKGVSLLARASKNTNYVPAQCNWVTGNCIVE
jgi:hypothetical protein